MGSTERTRAPVVAGRFYPTDSAALRGEVPRHLGAAGAALPRRAHGVLAPHAGYVYSGPVAAKVFAAVQIPERVIVLGPNHTGRGARIAVVARGRFRMPSGDVPIDEALAAAILAEAPNADDDDTAHRGEHSIEVELPFLQVRQPAVKIVPIVLGGLDEREAIDFGEALYRAACRIGGDVLVVASSDMSHYLPDARAREVDQVVLDRVLAFDPSALYRTVVDKDISMCGFIPAAVMLTYARRAGAGKPQLVGYATSGDAFGHRERVVGYAGVILPA